MSSIEPLNTYRQTSRRPPDPAGPPSFGVSHAAEQNTSTGETANRLRATSSDTDPPPESPFAVARDVQRNNTAELRSCFAPRFPFALVRDVRRNTVAADVGGRLWFLFAAVRDVQRNSSPKRAARTGERFYSLPCETCSGTRSCDERMGSVLMDVSIRCRARRTAEPSRRSPRATTRFLFAAVRDVQRSDPDRGVRHGVPVSIRCRARRTAEHGTPVDSCGPTMFLFAVVRDVQRNPSMRGVATSRHSTSFYSLSCETYSGTHEHTVCTQCRYKFLFAVVRDVQRNRQIWPSIRSRLCFYSLSCETYSGTVDSAGTAAAGFLFAVVRDVQRNEMQITSIEYESGSFYSRLFPIEGVGPDFAVVGASVRG